MALKYFQELRTETKYYDKRFSYCSYCPGNSQGAVSQELWMKIKYIWKNILVIWPNIHVSYKSQYCTWQNRLCRCDYVKDLEMGSLSWNIWVGNVITGSLTTVRVREGDVMMETEVGEMQGRIVTEPAARRVQKPVLWRWLWRKGRALTRGWRARGQEAGLKSVFPIQSSGQNLRANLAKADWLVSTYPSGSHFSLLKDFSLCKGLQWQRFYSLSSVDSRFLVPGSSWSHGFPSCTCIVLSLWNNYRCECSTTCFKEAKPV